MRLQIHHLTRYRFAQPVSNGLQQIRKTPKTAPLQRVLSWSTSIFGGRKEASFEDHHRNVTELVSLDRGAQLVEIVSEGVVDVINRHGIVGAHRGAAPLWLYKKPTPRTALSLELRSFAQKLCCKAPDDALGRMHRLSDMIREAVTYEIGASEPSWSADDALKAGRGVCQDHTHIFLAIARLLGLPARYVSGYLMLDNQTAQEAMHGWAEVYLQDLGWTGFDVSNGISPDARYVRAATGLDYSDAAPISGVRVGGEQEELEVQIQIVQQ